MNKVKAIINGNIAKGYEEILACRIASYVVLHTIYPKIIMLVSLNFLLSFMCIA